MEEKKPRTIRLSTLILLIIILALIGGIVYFVLQNNELKIKQEQSKLETQALQGKVEQLKNTIDEVRNVTSNTVTNTVENTTTNTTDYTKQNSVSNKSTQNTTKKEETTKVDNQKQNNDNLETGILGVWKISKVLDSAGHETESSIMQGYGPKTIEFKENGVLIYNIGVTASSDNGSYNIKGNTINYGVPTDTADLSWSTMTYVPEENVLKEEIDWSGEEETIIYVKAK